MTMSSASTPDPFALFALPPRYALDQAELEQRFFAQNRELHPDRFATAPAAERVAALSRSRALNDAYQVLRKPVARAEYLLARAGGQIGDNERLAPAFLMEILELREELAEVRHSKSLPPAQKTAELERLARSMKARRTAELDKLAPLFHRVEEAGAAGEPAAVEEIKQTLIALRYLDRYLEECDAALDSDSET
jgi:molecular chaperone HscB